jgi:type VI secretion system lysozyme-like protein
VADAGEGGRALLFERLVDESPRTQAELRPFRTHDAEGLRASVLRRLDLLLNTRATRLRPSSGVLTVLDFGLPDYSSNATRDSALQKYLAREIQRTIEAFEPRLAVASVNVSLADNNERTLKVELLGRIRGESTTEPVAFTIPLSGQGNARETL